MPALPQPPIGRHFCRHGLFALAMLSLLGGCGTPNYDFGEVRPSLVSDSIHDWLGPAAVAPGAASTFELTDDERQLRDLAFPLIEPPYDRQKWESVLREYGLIGNYRPGAYDRTTYAARLLSADYRSPASRYAQLTDDIRNDITRLPQFFETAARVVDIDTKRRKSLSYISAVSPAERANALRRNRENNCIIAWVRELAQSACRVVPFRARAAGDHDAFAGRRAGGADAQSSAAKSKITTAPPCRRLTHRASSLPTDLWRSSADPDGRIVRRRARLAPSATGPVPAPVRGLRSARLSSAIRRSAGRLR